MGGTMFTTVEPNGWSKALGGLAGDEPYYQPGYHQAFADEVDAEALLYHFELGGERLVHPFLLRPIDKIGAEDAPLPGLKDIESVYGYSGPLATTQDPEFLTAAWQDYRVWCDAQGVVCEFTRFHPFLESHRFADDTMTITADRTTVDVQLGIVGEAEGVGATPEHRNRVRKAEKAGLSCHQAEATADNLSRFQRLYRATMQHVGATDFYYFSDQHLQNLVEGLPKGCTLFFVEKSGELIAGALFLISADRLYYHLGGSLPEYRQDAPNNFLFQQAIDWAAAQRLKGLYMGGGRNNALDDELLRFKRKLQADRTFERTFRFGKCIRNPETYEAITQSWLAQAGGRAPSMLQYYRLDLSAQSG